VNDVALEEVNIGTLDYVVLRNNNTSGCSANLDGLSLAFVAGKPADFTFDLPSYTLAAGATVFVVEGTPQPQDISTATNIDIGPLDGAYIALCNGVCNASDGSNVIDLVATSGVSGLPPPLTFSSPLTGITDTNENTTSYVRVAHDGAPPNFRGTDWAIGQASRIPACDPAACTGCNPALLQTPCCTTSDTCGCRTLVGGTCTPI
jgi:hypothetical protein